MLRVNRWKNRLGVRPDPALCHVRVIQVSTIRVSGWDQEDSKVCGLSHLLTQMVLTPFLKIGLQHVVLTTTMELESA